MRDEQVVCVPARFMLSLNATGTPASGPHAASAAPAASAAARVPAAPAAPAPGTDATAADSAASIFSACSSAHLLGGFQEGVGGAVEGAHAIERGCGHLAGAELAGGEARLDVAHAHAGERVARRGHQRSPPFAQNGRHEEAPVLLLRRVLQGDGLREAGFFGVLAHDVRETPDGMERGRHAREVVFGDGLQAVDDGVQVDGHLRHLGVGKPDARIFRNAAHVAFGEMLGHGGSLFPSRFARPRAPTRLRAAGRRTRRRATVPSGRGRLPRGRRARRGTAGRRVAGRRVRGRRAAGPSGASQGSRHVAGCGRPAGPWGGGRAAALRCRGAAHGAGNIQTLR